MKILICNYEYPPLGGGGGVISQSLAEAMSDEHEVTVLTSSAYELVDEEVINGVKIVRVPVYFRNELQTANMASLVGYVVNGRKLGSELVKKEKFDVINSHFAVPTGPVGQHLGDVARIPHVLSAHGGDIYDPSKFMSPHRHWFLRQWVRGLLNKSESVIVSSKNIDGYIDQFYDKALETTLVPLGIPRPADVVPDRASFGFEDDDFLMVTVGRLVERKSVNQLVSLVSKLENEKTKLIVIGGGPKLSELKEQAVSLGVQDKIKFMGQTSEHDKSALLSMSNLYVSCSQHEGFGLVFLEGMAYGLPVVCYNEGGQTDFVLNDSNGFVVELNDLDTFKSKVLELQANEKLVSRLSRGSYDQVENYFIDTCARQYLEVFEKAIASYKL